MLHRSLSPVRGWLRRMVGAQPEVKSSDAQLLERFLREGDEAAFAALVGRHGPSVLGTCCRVTGQEQDAEDAFQAVFLVLARKGSSLGGVRSLAGWLHGVALRVSLRARTEAARRRNREQLLPAAAPAADPLKEAAHRDLCRVLDEELAALPENYRVPILLCDLRGQTHEEAARELGCPVGSMSWRLEKGRKLLRARLLHRGVTGVVLAVPVVAVPDALAARTAHVGTLLGVEKRIPEGLVSRQVDHLRRGALKSMRLKRLIGTMGVVLALGLWTVGAICLLVDPEKKGGSGAISLAADDPNSPALSIPRNRMTHDEGPREKSAVVRSVAYSPDGKMLVSGSDYGTVKLWDVKLGKELAILKGGEGDIKGPVYSVAFSPDGKTLASGGWGIQLWDVKTGKEHAPLEGQGHREQVNSVVFSPNGKTLASGSGDDTVKLWDVKTGKELASLKGNTSGVCSVAFSRNGKTLAAGGADGTIRLWDILRRKSTLTLKGHNGTVSSVAFSPDGKTLASAGPDAAGWKITINLWDVKTGKVLATLEGHTGKVNSVVFSPDGRTLASGSEDRTIKLWDMAHHKNTLTLEGHLGSIPSVALSPDGRTLASGGEDATIKLWDVKTGREQASSYGYPANSVAFSPDGKTLAWGEQPKMALGDQQGVIVLWDVKTGKEQVIHAGHTNAGWGDYWVWSVAFSPDGKTLVSGGEGASGRTIKLWDVKTGKQQDTLTLEGQDGVRSVAFSRDAKTLAAACEDKNEIKLWDVKTGKVRATLKGHSDLVSFVAFSPAGNTLASGSEDKTVLLWDVRTGRMQATLKGHTGAVNAVAFSSDGKTLASASEDKTIKLWDIAGHKNTRTLAAESVSVAFSPDGKTLASAPPDGTIRLWDVKTGKVQVTLKGTGNVLCLAFSPDGRMLASASVDGTTKLWDVSAAK